MIEDSVITIKIRNKKSIELKKKKFIISLIAQEKNNSFKDLKSFSLI